MQAPRSVLTKCLLMILAFLVGMHTFYKQIISSYFFFLNPTLALLLKVSAMLNTLSKLQKYSQHLNCDPLLCGALTVDRK